MKPLIFALLTIWSGRLLAQPPVAYAEWFVGPDPGYGQATPFTGFSPDTLIEASAQLNLSNVSPGLHHCYFRVKDSDGRWSQTLSRPFFVFPAEAPPAVVRLEWFWDVDPGYGQANPVAIMPGDPVEATWAVDLAGLPPGIHNLYARMQDADGAWSPTSHSSTVIRAEPDARIEKIEYSYQDASGPAASFTYALAQPRHYVDLGFDPVTDSLATSGGYELCLAVVRTDGARSFERCSSFSWTAPVGVGERVSPVAFEVFPNPNDGNFRLRLPEERKEPAYLSLVDAQGRRVFFQEVRPEDASALYVNLGQAEGGIYFAILEMGNSVGVKKVVVR